jgi:DNA-binding MarR family transcriptional regulator
MDSTIWQEAEVISEQVRVINRLLRQAVEADMEQSGLTAPQVTALRILVKSGGLSLKELSARMGLAHSTVSGIVDRLEKRELVARQVDPDDRRISRVVVTDLVTQYVGEVMQSQNQSRLARALQLGAPEERRLVQEGLRLLGRWLEEVSEGPPPAP